MQKALKVVKILTIIFLVILLILIIIGAIGVWYFNDKLSKVNYEGIPESEIAFIHDANTETRKKELFAKVRSGQVRVLMGSTNKMGAGTNVQAKIKAIHHLDCPWRPADLTQRNRQTE